MLIQKTRNWSLNYISHCSPIWSSSVIHTDSSVPDSAPDRYATLVTQLRFFQFLISVMDLKAMCLLNLLTLLNQKKRRNTTNWGSDLWRCIRLGKWWGGGEHCSRTPPPGSRSRCTRNRSKMFAPGLKTSLKDLLPLPNAKPIPAKRISLKY